jgi:cytochrome b561
MTSGTDAQLGGGREFSCRHRYSGVAITLHWAIAAAILALLGSGLWMTDAIKAPETQATAFAAYQWHKSLGLTVLTLSLLRLVWRLFNPPPPLPQGMGLLARMFAHGTHATFYVLMIGMPLIGWAMVSASVFGLPTIVFGLFEWPHIPMLASLEDKVPVEVALKAAHRTGAYLMIALLILHVAAALKHHFVDRDHVLARMLPGLSR